MHHRRALGPIQYHQLQEPAGSIGTKNQIPRRILGDFLHDQRVAQDVVNVLWVDVVAQRRPENLHERIVLQNLSGVHILATDLVLYVIGLQPSSDGGHQAWSLFLRDTPRPCSCGWWRLWTPRGSGRKMGES